jgi:hypothetical protein
LIYKISFGKRYFYLIKDAEDLTFLKKALEGVPSANLGDARTWTWKQKQIKYLNRQEGVSWNEPKIQGYHVATGRARTEGDNQQPRHGHFTRFSLINVAAVKAEELRKKTETETKEVLLLQVTGTLIQLLSGIGFDIRHYCSEANSRRWIKIAQILLPVMHHMAISGNKSPLHAFSLGIENFLALSKDVGLPPLMLEASISLIDSSTISVVPSQLLRSYDRLVRAELSSNSSEHQEVIALIAECFRNEDASDNPPLKLVLIPYYSEYSDAGI